MKFISKYNKGIRFLLCVIDIFSKYACVVRLKEEKGVTIVNAFQSILDNSKTKPNKIWIDQESEFYNNSSKNCYKTMTYKCIQRTMEENLLLLKRFTRTLKKYIYKHIAAVPINVYFHVSDDIVDKDNNAYHSTIKMKPLDVKSNFYVDVKFDVKF